MWFDLEVCFMAVGHKKGHTANRKKQDGVQVQVGASASMSIDQIFPNTDGFLLTFLIKNDDH